MINVTGFDGDRQQQKKKICFIIQNVKSVKVKIKTIYWAINDAKKKTNEENELFRAHKWVITFTATPIQIPYQWTKKNSFKLLKITTSAYDYYLTDWFTFDLVAFQRVFLSDKFWGDFRWISDFYFFTFWLPFWNGRWHMFTQ